MRLPTKYALALILAVALALPGGLAAQRAPQNRRVTNYQVFTLPNSLGGTVSGAKAINDLGWAMGSAAHAGNKTSEAALWIEGKMIAGARSVGPTAPFPGRASRTTGG